MSRSERRHEQRANPSIRLNPVNCFLVADSCEIPLEIVNYHHRGACFRTSINDYRLQSSGAYLKFKIGKKELSEKIIFRIIWETIGTDGSFGVEFNTESSYVLERSERYLVNNINTPVISCQDPLDPNRIIYLKLVNASVSGMLLSTSLSNKHIFPGMELRGAILEIPTIGKTEVDLFIENSRASDDKKTLNFGTSVKSNLNNYKDLIAKYLSTLGTTKDVDNRSEALAKDGLIRRNLKQFLTIKQTTTAEDYEKVLKLRYKGYDKAGKIDKKVTYHQMGEGLEKEGTILSAYLGGQIVASVELRFSSKMKLRLQEKFNFEVHPYLSRNQFVEINKLVVDPAIQRSDIVVGLFQKIHSVTMLNGKPDGLLVADDKLVSLYKRLGAKTIGVSFPHPVKEKTFLHVMCIPRATYEGGEKIHPLAWSEVYKTTQDFMAENGYGSKNILGNWSKFLIRATKFILPFQSKYKRKNKNTRRDEPAPANSIGQSHEKVAAIIDPKWTVQHLHASVLLPYLLVSDQIIDKNNTDKILSKLGFKRGYFSSSGNWISIAFFDEFIAEFKKIGDVNELQKLAGYKNLSKEVLGVNHFLLKHFLTPGAAFKAFGGYLPKFNKTRTYQVIESSSNYCKIRIGVLGKEYIPKDPSAKQNWLAILDAHVLVITGKSGKVEQTKSIFDGDEYCEYLVFWSNPLLSTKTLIGAAAGIASLAFMLKTSWAYFSQQSPIIVSAIVLLTVFCAALLYKYFTANKKYHEMIESLGNFQKDADEKYKDLQNSKNLVEKNYQEGKLLEKISKDIQSTDEVTSTLNQALDSICSSFSFSRAFIMICDEDRKYLRTTAMHGAADSANQLWSFKVDIAQKRESPLVLSSVYHSGQSILISDVNEHLANLNEASQALIRNLGTQGFAMVPIPSADPQNWGVLVADKGNSKEIITRRDLVALQRIAQSLGIALDKKSKLESEIRTRKIFQKYVPSVVIEKVLGEKDAKLGGQSKEAICLFFDIRNFTALSTQIPPEILCELLNNIYDLLHKSVSKTNGVIDKFLGDGALVTWGAIPGSEINPEQAILTAKEFFHELDKLNSTISLKGLKPIEVGMGIHRGQVVAGNIGTTERMEFTVIGNTVNIASRLEQLSKIFNCHLVISQELIPFENLDSSWIIKSDVQVRGLDKTIKVAVYAHIPPVEMKKVETA